MTIYTEDIADSVVVSDRANEEEIARSVIYLLDLVGHGVSFVVPDTVNVSDAMTADAAAMLADTITVSDAAVPTMQHTVDEADVVAVRDALGPLQITASESDSVTVTDAAVPNVTVIVGEVVAVSDAAVPTLHAVVLAADTVRVSDLLSLGLGYDAQDSVTVSDALAASRTLEQIISDLISVQDSIGGGSAVVMDLLDAAVASDAATHRATTHAEAEDVVALSDRASFANPLAAAWVMNTETTGMSRYEGYDFESIAMHDGKLYGVNRDGLYLLEGSTDAGVKINALVERGFDDMGTPYKKRVPFVYLGYKSDGRLKLTVETLDRTTLKASYYTAVLPAYMPVNTRIVPGKGLVGAYIRFTLENVLGADFDLDKWAADVAVSTTRRMS